MRFTRDRFFIDTNILVYANDRSSPDKQSIARELIAHAFASRLGCLSTQVLQEFFVVATRKAGVPASNARAQVIKLSELDTVLLDDDIIVGAIDLHIIHQISFWDAMVIKAAAKAGSRRIFTEDLTHGQTLDGVQIVNPFR